MSPSPTSIASWNAGRAARRSRERISGLLGASWAAHPLDRPRRGNRRPHRRLERRTRGLAGTGVHHCHRRDAGARRRRAAPLPPEERRQAGVQDRAEPSHCRTRAPDWSLADWRRDRGSGHRPARDRRRTRHRVAGPHRRSGGIGAGSSNAIRNRTRWPPTRASSTCCLEAELSLDGSRHGRETCSSPSATRTRSSTSRRRCRPPAIATSSS